VAGNSGNCAAECGLATLNLHYTSSRIHTAEIPNCVLRTDYEVAQ
jgi:hypothetical protein